MQKKNLRKIYGNVKSCRLSGNGEEKLIKLTNIVSCSTVMITVRFRDIQLDSKVMIKHKRCFYFRNNL